jgi:phage terminase small subunit
MPARKPRALKAVAGTIRPCRDKPELELPKVEGLPEAPQFLDIVAATEFDRVARVLHGAGVLTEADFGLLTAYAAAWSDLVRHWENRGRPKSAELTAFRQLATELGLSPKARAGLPPPRDPKKGNRFLGVGKKQPK